MREKLRREAFAAAKSELDSYLEMNNHRKTPERYAILEAVFGINSHFSLNRLADYLQEEKNFIVSRPTLYNTMRLFVKLRLVLRHNIGGKTEYEPCFNSGNHVHQVCTSCGKVTIVPAQMEDIQLLDVKLKRFRPEAFAMYIYGICSKCQAKLTRQKRTSDKKQNKKNTKQ